MGRYLYVYGFLPPINQDEQPELKGILENENVKFHEIEGVTAVCTPVDSQNFSEENLQHSAENMEWLKDHAFHHHEVVNELSRLFRIIPLSFGTVYESMQSLEEVLRNKQKEIKQLFDYLADKEEWSLKVYADRHTFDAAFTQDAPLVKERRREIEQMPRGKQFFALKNMDSWLQEKTERQLEYLCSELHQSLLPLTSDHEKKKLWEKKLSGRKDEMVWNSVYLFKDGQAAEEALVHIREFQKRAEREYKGLTVEASGPWPSYHFAKLQHSGAE
ncbi:GvpL/GvpF family gas vesicle protein [Alkalicoccus daliensis]|uniref:GvpL/GvpF family gas vesicle protein n=1 Tax=Alkalicoccus daliensis TaxID=745820 RepID=UPI001586082B|nr:GvpL/GvpF family gas vesicle protein [Alkalicoccus daliensis]